MPTLTSGGTALLSGSNRLTSTEDDEVEYDYAQFTGSVSPTATTEGAADTLVTGASVAYDGSTVVVVEFFAVSARGPASSAHNGTIYLFEDGSSIGAIGSLNSPSSTNGAYPVHLRRRLTPSAGSHTYSIRMSVDTGTGFVNAGPGGSGQYAPGFIRITKA